MSQQLIARSLDLLRLRNEGYTVCVNGGYLLIEDVPYVNSATEVKRGTLVSKLDLAGDQTTKPSDHVAYWIGEHPCHADGRKITAIENSSAPQDLGNNIRVDATFSAKADYRDYYHKVTTYIGRISGEATKIEPNATAQTFPAIPEDNDEKVFKYVDTASSRANIGKVNEKLAGLRIGIIGLGGTGAYILDQVAKTWVEEIHLFDGDVFSQHNAFRAPSAPTLKQLQDKLKKVTYFSDLYSNMRHGIITHDEFVSESNLALLDNLDFVFICIDQGTVKHLIVDCLTSNEIAFVDVGMGVDFNNEQLIGLVRTVISTPQNRDFASPHISYDDNSGDNEYATNIQIADLNILNAAIAVILWKKHYGIYGEVDSQYYSGYSILTGDMASECTESIYAPRS
jgi:molybdopterin/thiamine biosynthesis adenylyltransferase